MLKGQRLKEHVKDEATDGTFSGTVGLEGAQYCPHPTLPLPNIHEHRDGIPVQLAKLSTSQKWLEYAEGQESWNAQFCSCFYPGLLAGQTVCLRGANGVV